MTKEYISLLRIKLKNATKIYEAIRDILDPKLDTPPGQKINIKT